MGWDSKGKGTGTFLSWNIKSVTLKTMKKGLKKATGEQGCGQRSALAAWKGGRAQSRGATYKLITEQLKGKGLAHRETHKTVRGGRGKGPLNTSSGGSGKARAGSKTRNGINCGTKGRKEKRRKSIRGGGKS